MEIDEAFTSYLLARPGLTALIARRFHSDELPQAKPGETVLPAVVYIKVSDVKSHTLTGQSNLERPVFQFTAYASTKAGAKAVSRQLKTALCDYHGTMSGIIVQKIELQNEMSNLDKSSDGTTKVYSEDLEFEISFIKEG